MLDIYDYTDYREFLKGLYAERKEANRAFSYRFIASRAGFASPSFVGKILSGDTNISQQTLLRLTDAFGLAGAEAEYFEALVNFSQSISETDRRHYFERLQRLRRRRRGTPGTTRDALESEWFVPCVLNLVRLGLFDGDHTRLARLVTPPVTSQQVRLAIETLSFHGWIARSADGRWLARNPNELGESVFPLDEQADSLAGFDSVFDTDNSTFSAEIPEHAEPLLKKRITALRTELKRLYKRARRGSRSETSSRPDTPPPEPPSSWFE